MSINVYLPGHGGFIRSWLQQSLFERGFGFAAGHYDADLIIDARGPSRPQDFIDGKVGVGGLFKKFIISLSTNADAKRPYVLLSSTDVEVNNNPYTALKLAQESALRAYGTCYGFPVVIVRTSCVFGPGMDPRRFIPLAARALRAGTPVPIHAGSIRQWTYAPALADWIIDSHFETNHQRHHGPQHYVNWTLTARAMAQAVAEALAKPLFYAESDFHASNPGHYRFASSDLPLTAPGLALDVALRRTLYSLGLLL